MQIVSLKNRFLLWMEGLKETWLPYLEEKEIIKKHEPELEEIINQAHQEWLEAQNYFDNVTEPELVDHAAYLMRAAESKYMYFLKKYKIEQK